MGEGGVTLVSQVRKLNTLALRYLSLILVINEGLTQLKIFYSHDCFVSTCVCVPRMYPVPRAVTRGGVRDHGTGVMEHNQTRVLLAKQQVPLLTEPSLWL